MSDETGQSNVIPRREEPCEHRPGWLVTTCINCSSRVAAPEITSGKLDKNGLLPKYGPCSLSDGAAPEISEAMVEQLQGDIAKLTMTFEIVAGPFRLSKADARAALTAALEARKQESPPQKRDDVGWLSTSGYRAIIDKKKRQAEAREEGE